MPEPTFELLETLAFHPDEGYRRLEGHLRRLRRSAAFFGIPVDEGRPARTLDEAGAGLAEPSRVRLLVDLLGRVRVEAAKRASHGGVVRVGLAPRSVDRHSPFLRHKTTRREVYEEAVRSRPDVDDVLLFNDRGEITESTVANLAVSGPGGMLVTPRIDCGLLPGVEREALLGEGRLREGTVRVADLVVGQRLFLLNSVRGLYEAIFVG
jgi:branched-subunit amino acid aminotransferase/4-amino-4-deoxychorismate lyase